MISQRMFQLTKRFLDLVFLAIALLLLWPLFLAVIIYIKVFGGSGPILYWSKRVGRGNVIFLMPKFRTMKVSTPEVATHLLNDPKQYLICGGSFLRSSSLDELPQLWSIFRGDMSFVGPRPALFNQHDLVELRSNFGVHLIKPGLTGWAQVNGRDELSIEEKVVYDRDYLARKTIWFDMKIIWLTFLKVVKRAGISH